MSESSSPDPGAAWLQEANKITFQFHEIYSFRKYTFTSQKKKGPGQQAHLPGVRGQPWGSHIQPPQPCEAPPPSES